MVVVSILSVPVCQVSADTPIFPIQNEEILDLIENGLGFEVGETREQTFVLLGEPLKRKTETVENKYYEFEDEFTVYYWSGWK